jgi:hypothetical protein
MNGIKLEQYLEKLLSAFKFFIDRKDCPSTGAVVVDSLKV